MIKHEIINGVKVRLRRLYEKTPSGKTLGRKPMDNKKERVYKTVEAPRAKRQRKEIKVDDRLRRSIMGLSKMGLSYDQIADTVGVSKTWLKQNYINEIRCGRQIANALVVENLYQQAMKDTPSSVQAGIYITKSQLGWRDKPAEDEFSRPAVVFDFSNLPYEERMAMLHKLTPRMSNPKLIEGEVIHDDSDE
jgi:hypothetical protein